MWRVATVLAIGSLAAGCSSSSSDPHEGDPSPDDSTGSAAGPPTAPAINGGAASGPAVNGGAASGPSVGAGGSTAGTTVGKGGAVSMPAVGSSSGGGQTASCAQVAQYAASQGTPQQCAACLESSCCGALLGCYNNPDCLAYTQCVGSCSGGPSSSASPNCGCDSQYPNGMSAYDDYAQCAIGSCKSTCVSATVMTGGSGGPPGGTSCQSGGASCSQNSDCCSNICATDTSSGTPISYCE